MASTNKTTNFELPQWISTDKPTFEGDLNSAFLTIDNTMESNKTTAETGNANANSALEKIGNLTLLETTVKDNLVNAINEIVSGGTTPSEIGDLQDLTTSAKNNIVSAINEVDALAKEIETITIGELSDLTTSAKNNIVSAINEVDGLAKELESDNTNISSQIATISGQITNISGQITDLQGDITPLETNVNNLTQNLGTLSSLTTSAKNNIVSAINEVNANTLLNKNNSSVQTLNGSSLTISNVTADGTLKYINSSKAFLMTGRLHLTGTGLNSLSTFQLGINSIIKPPKVVGGIAYTPIGMVEATDSSQSLLATGMVSAYYDTDNNTLACQLDLHGDVTNVANIYVSFYPVPITDLQ